MHRLVVPSSTPLVLAVVITYASTYPKAGPDPATVEQPAATDVRVADDRIRLTGPRQADGSMSMEDGWSAIRATLAE
jgi:hypothetical protein